MKGLFLNDWNSMTTRVSILTTIISREEQFLVYRIPFTLLVHLDQRSMWTIAISWRLSSKLFTFRASSPKPLGQLEPNLAGMFLGWSSTKFLFFVPVGYSTWLPVPIICSDWPKFQRSSLKLMNWLNPNCKWKIIGMSITKFLFLCRSEIQDGRHRRT